MKKRCASIDPSSHQRCADYDGHNGAHTSLAPSDAPWYAPTPEPTGKVPPFHNALGYGKTPAAPISQGAEQPSEDVFDVCRTCGHYRGEHGEKGCFCEIVSATGSKDCPCGRFVEPAPTAPRGDEALDAYRDHDDDERAVLEVLNQGGTIYQASKHYLAIKIVHLLRTRLSAPSGDEEHRAENGVGTPEDTSDGNGSSEKSDDYFDERQDNIEQINRMASGDEAIRVGPEDPDGYSKRDQAHGRLLSNDEANVVRSRLTVDGEPVGRLIYEAQTGGGYSRHPRYTHGMDAVVPSCHKVIPLYAHPPQEQKP